jgi:hypothetical protein
MTDGHMVHCLVSSVHCCAGSLIIITFVKYGSLIKGTVIGIAYTFYCLQFLKSPVNNADN